MRLIVFGCYWYPRARVSRSPRCARAEERPPILAGETPPAMGCRLTMGGPYESLSSACPGPAVLRFASKDTRPKWADPGHGVSSDRNHVALVRAETRGPRGRDV